MVNISTSSTVNLCEEHIDYKVLKEFYEDKVMKTKKEMINMCINTVTQSDNKMWCEFRKLRISVSSKAHFIKTRCKKTCAELAEKFICTEDNKKIKSLEYGLIDEKKAVLKFI